MAVSRGLIISLGVSALSCTILFLYFRNKITTIERKVDVMFDLIQNHESQQQNMRYEMAPPQYNPEPQQNVSREMENDLIDVSDDDLSDDSREVSDDEEDESDNEDSKISVDNSETIPLGDDEVKKIVVPMVSNDHVNLEETPLEEVTDSLDEIDDDEDDEDGVEDNITLETVNISPEVIEVVKKTDTDVSVEDDVENLDNNEEQEGEQELDELDELDDLDDDSDDDDEEEDEIDYSKLKVSELKALAKEKGLTNYKSLKKAPLVELLKSSE